MVSREKTNLAPIKSTSRRCLTSSQFSCISRKFAEAFFTPLISIRTFGSFNTSASLVNYRTQTSLKVTMVVTELSDDIAHSYFLSSHQCYIDNEDISGALCSARQPFILLTCVGEIGTCIGALDSITVDNFKVLASNTNFTDLRNLESLLINQLRSKRNFNYSWQFENLSI